MNAGEIILATLIASVVTGAIAYVAFVYSRLVGLKHQIQRAWTNLDHALARRHDELPKLVKTVEAYLDPAGGALVWLNRARLEIAEAETVPDRAWAEGLLSEALERVLAAAESHPQLRSHPSLVKLGTRIRRAENRIADRLEPYNETATAFNACLERAPYRFVARWLSLAPAEPFEARDRSGEFQELARAS